MYQGIWKGGISMLRIKNLYKKFDSVLALNGLCMDIAQGELYGFVGPNGAGKTTTLKIIAGLLRPTDGEIWFEGKRVESTSQILKGDIGYLPDSFGVYDNLDIGEYLEFFASAYGLYGKECKMRIGEVLDLVELTGYEKRNANELSRGVLQRLCLARALIHKPKLLLMDEPTLGLDPMARRTLKNTLRNLCQEGYSVLVSSHDLNDLSDTCSKYGIIHQGKMVFQGEMEEIIVSIENSNPILITVYQNVESAIEVLRGNPYVSRISIDKNRFSILFDGTKEEEAMLIRELIENNVLISSFRREYNDLETLFFHIAMNDEIQKKGGSENCI